jgi:hypothetical protein
MNVNKKDIERFQEFEKKILSLKEDRVKYTPDLEMESKIKMEVLVDHFGEEKTNQLIEKLGLSRIELSNQETFVEIYKFLEQLN